MATNETTDVSPLGEDDVHPMTSAEYIEMYNGQFHKAPHFRVLRALEGREKMLAAANAADGLRESVSRLGDAAREAHAILTGALPR